MISTDPTLDAAPIRSLFSNRRPIDRPIEKVIDYYAGADDSRLRNEVAEYEVTGNVEENLRRLLRYYSDAVRGGQVTEIGVWVSGFYGSGKSSFTKYVGLALDPGRVIDGRPFRDLLAERINPPEIKAELLTLAQQYPATVIMLDLGSEQLAARASESVSTVLYWKVLQRFGFSKIEKLAYLEFCLDREGRLEAFKQAYRGQFGGEWDSVHDEPMRAVAAASQLVPRFYPREYPDTKAFMSLRFSLAGDLRDQAGQMLDLIRRKTGRENVIFLIDEVGQYVAPRSELILNLDGLARNFKELGQGKVWIVATGQQTLTEIVERAALNSSELNKLRDRFPIALTLDATDIREITWRRLLTKSADGERALQSLFRQNGQALVTHTRLAGSRLDRGELDAGTFARLYPFLPSHFDLLLELTRVLARSTGGVGLRSAIRVIQDVLVDASKVQAAGATRLADLPVGRLATVDLLYDTLRMDIARDSRHIVDAVDRVSATFPGDPRILRVAKAVAALQPIANFPRSAENLAALLYERIGDPPNRDGVADALRRLLEAREIGLVDDPQTGGFTFLSEDVKPLRKRRNEYQPTAAELNQQRNNLLKEIFTDAPSTTLDGAKVVKAGVSVGRVPIVGEGEDVQFRLEIVERARRDERYRALLGETTGGPEWKTSIAWLIAPDESVDDLLAEIVRSDRIVRDNRDSDSRDIAQFVRSEERAGQVNRETVQRIYRAALADGTLIFRGNPTPAAVAGPALDDAARKVLGAAAAQIFPSFRLVPIRPAQDLAARFLGVERLDRLPSGADPLNFVTLAGGRPRVLVQRPALAEALRALRTELDTRGVPRIQGNALQDLFAAAPYGWSKDATRYVIAGLLVAGEVVIHTSGGELKTAGPLAARAFGSAHEFSRAGVAIRDSRPSNEALERAAARLEALCGVEIFPLEAEIGQAARKHLPGQIEEVSALPAQLQLLALAGADRARNLVETGRSILAGDAVGAVALLGARACEFPDDLRWAKEASRALENGADEEIRTARSLIGAAERLEQLFPGMATGLVSSAEKATVAEVLASENFAQQLTDLRAVTREIRDRASAGYAEQFAAYQGELAAGRDRLEARPAWLQVSEEDRTEIGRRLAPSVPGAPAREDPLGSLGLLLARRAQIPTLESELIRELERRAPPPAEPSPRSAGEVEVDVFPLLPDRPLADTGDLDDWLASLRQQLRAALEAGTPIRLRVKP